VFRIVALLAKDNTENVTRLHKDTISAARTATGLVEKEELIVMDELRWAEKKPRKQAIHQNLILP
jgi:hypothetical protein